MAASLSTRAYDWIFLLDPSKSSRTSDLNDDDSDKCLLFTDAYGRLMQVMLAVSALVIMYIKRKLETPMRPVRVWALDLSKQCCGAFLVHCLSIVLSIVFVARAANQDDECGVYFVTYMVDTTWGVVLVLLFLKLEHAIAQKYHWTNIVESGFYGDPPQLTIWSHQLAAYALAVLMMKMLDSLLILYYYEPLAKFATDLFRSFTHHRHLELLLVMIIIPGCCNSFQFWIVDSYLKCDGSHWKYFTALVASDDEQPPAEIDHKRLSMADGSSKTSSSSSSAPIVQGAPPVLLANVKISYDAASSMPNSIISSAETTTSGY